jgi:hypothetical protein
VDAESQRALILVLIGGSIVVAVATAILLFVFRAYGGAKAGSASHGRLVAALVAFIFACCVGLYVLSYSGR